MSDDKDQWKETAGLAADSTVAQIVCKEPDKEGWDEEAEEKGYRSTSKYLYELVQEARAYRQQGYLAHHQSEEQIAELKSRIEELETQLERERKKQSTGCSHRTLNSYSRTLKKFFHEQFPDLTPSEVTVRHVEDYVVSLDQRGLSQNTKRRYLESLSAFYDWTMKRPRFENITGNPAAVVLEDIPKKIRERPDCATWQNGAEIIREMTDPRNKTVAVLLAKTGCRVSEALEVKMDDLMLDEGFGRLRERKGGKQTVVPVDKERIQAIERFKFTRPSNGDSDYLFLSIRGNRVSKTQVQRAVKNAAVEADVMERGEDRFHKKFTPHTYRTVFTTLMRNQGMKQHFLRYIRGDAASETMDIYTRVGREDARKEYLDCIKTLNL